MINRLFSKKSEEKLKRFMGQTKDEAIRKAARLKKLELSTASGWMDYIQLLNDYVERIKQRKRATRLDVATDAEIEQLKYLDHEAQFIETFIKMIPSLFVRNLDKALEIDKKAEKRDATKRT